MEITFTYNAPEVWLSNESEEIPFCIYLILVDSDGNTAAKVAVEGMRRGVCLSLKKTDDELIYEAAIEPKQKADFLSALVTLCAHANLRLQGVVGEEPWFKEAVR